MKFIFKRFKNEKIHERKKIFIIISLIYLCSTFYFNKNFYNKKKRIVINSPYPIKNNSSAKTLTYNRNLFKNLKRPIYRERILKNGKKFINKCLYKTNEKYHFINIKTKLNLL